MFHHFWNASHQKGQGALSAEELAELIEFLGPKRFLSAESWYERALAGRLEPKDLCLTFDDALLCQYEIAKPVLDSFNLTGFWFVYSSVFQGKTELLEIYRFFRTECFATMDAFYAAFDAALRASAYGAKAQQSLHGFVPANYMREHAFYSDNDRKFRYLRDEVLGPAPYHELMGGMLRAAGFNMTELTGKLWMRDEHLSQLAAQGHIIGLHSDSHPTNIAAMSFAEQWREYEANFQHLRRVLGASPRTMSHPCNSYNEDTLEVLKKLEVSLGFRADMHGPKHSIMELPREDHINVFKAMRAS